jgi:hypothetical protein
MMRCNSSFMRVLLSFAVVCLGAKSAVPPKPAASQPPTIEVDARNALAAQWLSPNWKTCLDALDLATRPGAIFSDALALLTSGYDPRQIADYPSLAKKYPAKTPYKVPDADVDQFWDWVAGASTLCSGVCSQKMLQTALAAAEEVVNQYYRDDNVGLMDKVDANFIVKNPRRAIYELLRFAAKDTLAKEQDVLGSDKALQDSKKRLEQIRLCYATTPKGKDDKTPDYRKKLTECVSGKFRPPKS